jgi:hypothetical protein
VTILGASSLQQFIVASRDVGASFDLTVQAVQRTVASTPGARVLRTDSDTGVVVVEVPKDQFVDFKTGLGDGFVVDPNAGLQY